MRINNILLNKAKRSGFLTKVEVISQQDTINTDFQVEAENIISRKGDGDDITFFQKNRVLYHWLESYASWQSNAWTKLPKLPVTKSQILNILSGNPSAYAESNGDNIFLFFYDFADGNYNGWTVQAGTFSAVNYYLEATSADGNLITIDSPADDPVGRAMRMKIRTGTLIGSNGGPAMGYQDTSQFFHLRTHTDADELQLYKWSGEATQLEHASVTINTDAEYILELRWISASELKGEILSATGASLATVHETASGETWTTGDYGIRSWGPGARYDNVGIRKYASPEPAFVVRKISGKAGIAKAVCGGICS